jgi:hypothetical protein
VPMSDGFPVREEHAAPAAARMGAALSTTLSKRTYPASPRARTPELYAPAIVALTLSFQGSARSSKICLTAICDDNADLP